MMSRYNRLETGLRENWESMHEGGKTLGDLRRAAGEEMGDMMAMANAKAEKARVAKDLEEAEREQVREWLEHTMRSNSRMSESFVPAVAVPSPFEAKPTFEEPRVGGELRMKRWNPVLWNNSKDSYGPITNREQAEIRWNYIFGDTNVAFAPPGTGTGSAYAAGTNNSQTNRQTKFSHGSGWKGVTQGEAFKIATRASGAGPVSSITLLEESNKRASYMQSWTPRDFETCAGV